MLNRRQMLAASAAGAAFAAAPALAQPTTEDARLDVLLTRQFEEGLGRSPQGVTSLGLDVGARAGQRAELNDRSPAAVAQQRAINARNLEQLKTIRADQLSEEARLSYDIALFQREIAAAEARFPWHTTEGWRRTPYVISQIGGVYSQVPDFLDSIHPVNTREDADAYLARLAAFPKALDDDTERSRAHAEMGVVAPDFILDKTLLQLRALRDGASEEKAIVRSLDRRARDKGLGEDWGARAKTLFDGPVREALSRQIAEIERQRGLTSHEAGLGRVPDNQAYYALNLKAYTTTEYSADEIHRIGLEQVRDLQGQIDGLLKSEGYTQGSVAERLAALRKEPRFVWPNTDAGRAELLAYVNAEMAKIRALMPQVFPRIPKTDFVVRRVPPATEAGAPGGYAQGGSLDGSRPGAYYINLRDTAEWPRWTLKTLTYHEAAPGHLFQGALALEQGELPLYRRAGGGFSAYSEGWGLYSERLADELGVYEGDPFGRIGYLESFLFRANRLVVDTGLHSKGWSREQAIAWFRDNLGDPNETEVDRYCVAPGQACSYKLGEIFITNLREEMKRRPGFDLKRFHAAVIDGGNIPLTVLERRVKRLLA